MEKETKHYTLASFLKATKPLVRAEIVEIYPHLNMEYYDYVADMYFYVLELMVVQEIKDMDKKEFPIVQLINHQLRKHGLSITKWGIMLNF